MEKLMQYVWQQRLWPVAEMRTVDGKSIEVLDPGLLNRDAGPDFFNAKVVIGGETWVGNVEIHYRASDWHRHKHDSDKAYDSVILHVVDKDDAVIRRPDGQVIPQMRMPCDPGLNSRYSELVGRADIDLPCRKEIKSLPAIYITDWISNLAYERIYSKVDRIEDIRARLSGDWEQTCYVTVARGLGFGINGEPFERLALSVPLIFIGKHSDNLTAVEALLFGQSGLLDARATGLDPYAEHLAKEYAFLATKFGLKKPENPGWKMARTRPANFPHRRIATLAAMLHGGFRLMSRILDIKDIDSACELFTPELSPYWERRYSFGPESTRLSGSLSRSSALVMVINVVVPLMMAYGMNHGNTELTDRAIDMLHSIKAERNTIVELFERCGLSVKDAFTSQGLIQLRRNYCEMHKCLYCRIGHRKLSYHARRND